MARRGSELLVSKSPLRRFAFVVTDLNAEPRMESSLLLPLSLQLELSFKLSEAWFESVSSLIGFDQGAGGDGGGAAGWLERQEFPDNRFWLEVWLRSCGE